MDRPKPHALTPQSVAFEELNMQVGMRLQLLTHRHVKPAVYMSALIGYIKDEFMIVRVPTEGGMPVNLNIGERITIRVFSGINVGSFASTVERVYERPRPYLHITFPSVIQGSSLRGAMRVRADIPVTITSLRHADTVITGTLGDISVSGARIVSAHPLRADDDIVELSFALTQSPDQRPTLVNTQACIRNIVEPGDQAGAGYSYGVQFLELDPVHYILLQNMTYEALLSHRSKIV